jgi:hypothetical protein
MREWRLIINSVLMTLFSLSLIDLTNSLVFFFVVIIVGIVKNKRQSQHLQ